MAQEREAIVLSSVQLVEDHFTAAKKDDINDRVLEEETKEEDEDNILRKS